MIRAGMGNVIPNPTLTGNVRGVPAIIAKWGIPVISAPTGTIANNGAITLGTALPRTYARCYLILPAGAIATGVPAATTGYYTVMSSSTVGQVFNNTLSATGVPTVPASPAAFATTGPGAYTGTTTNDTLVTIVVPANYMGANGQVDIQTAWLVNNTVGAKTPNVLFGGTSYDSTPLASLTDWITNATVHNEGVTNAQSGRPNNLTAAFNAVSTGTIQTSAVDTTSAVNIVMQAQKATATDFMILYQGQVLLLSDGT